ncbi:MAG: hypothetical protein PARBA_03180 [Parabacteroides sp.]
MLPKIINHIFKVHQRITLVILLVLLQFYSFGSDFFPEPLRQTTAISINQNSPEVLDFDDHATIRTVRQEDIQLQAFEIDLISDWFTCMDIHGLIQSLELRICSSLPLFHNLHKADNFIWFSTFLL